MNGEYRKKCKLFVGLYIAVLFCFTVYVMLDTFVIQHTYVQVEDKRRTSGSAGNRERKAVITDTTYQDGNISVEIKNYRKYETNIYAADVTLKNASFLRTALAENVFGRNVTETTSQIAAEHNAILAVNGDYYGAQRDGYVIRGGTLYRSESREEDQEDLVIGADGGLRIIKEGDVTAEALLEQDVAEVLSFGPALIQSGEIMVDEYDEVGKAMVSNPRTVVAQLAPLHYLFVVSDGRTSESEGLSLYQMAEFLQGLRVDCAYNLDGGGSATMVFNGQVINKPTTRGRKIEERGVSDIVYIGAE